MKSIRARGMLLALVLAAIPLLFASGCTTPTSAVDAAGSSQSATQPLPGTSAEGTASAAAETDESAETGPQAKIIRQQPTVSQKGTHIRAIVNGQAITNYDIQRRAAFLNLRRVGGNRNEKALEELVDEAIKMQEARRVNAVASDAEVNASFANFAQSNRLSTSQLSQVLGQAGVGADHFKEFIRGQMSWQRAVGSRFQAETRRKSTQDALVDLRRTGGEKPTTTEFLLQQVIFVIPADKMKAMLPQRRKEAAAFRQLFTSCDATLKAAVGLRDVTVRNLPRVFEPQLPQEWAEEVKNTAQGQTTDIKNTDKGVEFLAVCKRQAVSDDDAARILSTAKEFETFNERGSDIAEGYLKELKAAAQIIYR